MEKLEPSVDTAMDSGLRGWGGSDSDLGLLSRDLVAELSATRYLGDLFHFSGG